MNDAGKAIEVNRTYLSRLRMLSIVEGVSTLLLFFVAMPLKYFAGMPSAVTIVGSIHGLLFTALVIAFLIGYGSVPLSARLTAWGILAAVIPFGPFVFDHSLKQLQLKATGTASDG